MKFWSKWPYWLRGGVVAIFITIPLILLDLKCLESASAEFIASGGTSDFSDLKCLPFDWPQWPLEFIFPDTWNTFSVAQYLFYIAVMWFILGALAGFILSLKRNKKSPLS